MMSGVKMKQKQITFPERKLRPRTKSVKYASEDEDEAEYFRATPSKRRCHSIENIKTTTPVNSSKKNNKNTTTPSSCFAKLTLDSPCGEKKNNLKPKELFPSNARKAFHGANATSLPGREKELKVLTDFLLKHLNEKSCGSLYISGKPGTGKTASLNYVIQQDEISSGYKIAKINCTSVSSSNSIYRKICEELNIKTMTKTEKESVAAVENYLLKKHKMILLVLDEIDQLETKSQSVLYRIFEWPSWEDVKLVLVGIANAVDLTDRSLPRLYAKVELQPILLHFDAYTKEQISKILNHKLSEAGGSGVFASGAIEMISAKVAGKSGDIRMAFDLGRRVMEISAEKIKEKSVEKSPVKKVLTEINSPRKPTDFSLSPRRSPRKLESTPQKKENNSPRKPIGFNLSPRKSPRKIDFNVDTKDVFNVVKNIYGSSKNFKSEDSCFPLHQKLLICTFLLVSKKGKPKDLIVSKLHQVYTKICKKKGITPEDLSGFFNLCRQVEMTGVIQMGKGPGKLAKVLLQWDETEISNAIQDTNLLSSILNDVTCLS